MKRKRRRRFARTRRRRIERRGWEVADLRRRKRRVRRLGRKEGRDGEGRPGLQEDIGKGWVGDLVGGVMVLVAHLRGWGSVVGRRENDRRGISLCGL